MERREKSNWQLDKNIPIPHLIAIGAQTIAIVFWAATLAADAKATRNDVNLLQASERINIATNQAFTGEIKERITRVETTVNLQSNTLDRIENTLRNHDQKR